MEKRADEQIVALTASGKPADLVTGFAAPLSIAVIADLLGVEITERDRFRELADAASRADFLAENGARTAAHAWTRFAGYVGELIATNAISVGVTQLITEGRLATLASCGTSEFDAVVEEIVHLQIGQIGEAFPRWAHEDIELAGTRIRAGDMVLARL